MTEHLDFLAKDVAALLERAGDSAAEQTIQRLIEIYGDGDPNRGFAHVWTQGSLAGLTLQELCIKARASYAGAIATEVSRGLPSRRVLERQFEESDRCSACTSSYSELLSLASPFFLVGPNELLAAEARTEVWFQRWLATGV